MFAEYINVTPIDLRQARQCVKEEATFRQRLSKRIRSISPGDHLQKLLPPAGELPLCRFIFF
jgi:hypothetical protein